MPPRTAATAKDVRINGYVQPRSWPSISAKVSAKSAKAEVMTPGTSMRRGPESSRDSRMATARYAGYLRASLPPFWSTTDGARVRAALERLRSA